MRIRRIKDKEFPSARIYVALGLMGLGYCVLLGSLWRLQKFERSSLEERHETQSLRLVRLPAIRGKIYDRNDICLADNTPDYSLALYVENIPRSRTEQKTRETALQVVEQVSELIGLEPQVDADDIRMHYSRRRPMPLTLWRNLKATQMARFSEMAVDIPGVDLYTQMSRAYPYGPYLSHLIGYVGRADIQKLNEEERYNYYLPDLVGRDGLEKVFDEFLRGEAGGKIVQIDVSGYHRDEMLRREPKRGGDIRLTLDTEIQLLAHQALGTNVGAVVVLDPNNGDVLAMVSSPSYDANLFVPSISREDWQRLNGDPDRPLYNRATAGAYPPGSTFKPLVGLAASRVDPHAISTVYDSPSTFRIGRRVVHTHGHGEVDMRQAIEESANVYFFKTALACGAQPILDEALAIGLGQKTGIQVSYEVGCVVPTAEWMRTTNKGGWTDGDTCNLSIGQGYLTTTPLQMAMVTATIANGGTLYKPRIVQALRSPDEDHFVDAPVRKEGSMNWSQTALTTVRGGMRDVLGENGTAPRAAVEGFDYAAKTGTAEYKENVDGVVEDKNHAWMIAFAPFQNPQYAVAFIIEDGVSGGRTVGPRLKLLMSGLYEKLKNEGRVINSQQTMFNSQHSMINAHCSLNIDQSECQRGGVS